MGCGREYWIPIKVDKAFPPEISGVPSSGVEGAVALDPNDPNVVLVAYSFTRSFYLSSSSPSVNLNVYRSTDGGKTFTPGDLSLPVNLSGETRGERLAIDPSNSKLVYFGACQLRQRRWPVTQPRWWNTL